MRTSSERLEVEVQASRLEITCLAKELLEVKLALESTELTRQTTEQSAITEQTHFFESLRHALDESRRVQNEFTFYKVGEGDRWASLKVEFL